MKTMALNALITNAFYYIVINNKMFIKKCNIISF
jgi:hypothetical protein